MLDFCTGMLASGFFAIAGLNTHREWHVIPLYIAIWLTLVKIVLVFLLFFVSNVDFRTSAIAAVLELFLFAPPILRKRKQSRKESGSFQKTPKHSESQKFSNSSVQIKIINRFKQKRSETSFICDGNQKVDSRLQTSIKGMELKWNDSAEGEEIGGPGCSSLDSARVLEELRIRAGQQQTHSFEETPICEQDINFQSDDKADHQKSCRGEGRLVSEPNRMFSGSEIKRGAINGSHVIWVECETHFDKNTHTKTISASEIDDQGYNCSTICAENNKSDAGHDSIF